MGFEADELQERFRDLSDDELLRMVDEEADQYRPEALSVARAELERRGLGEGTVTGEAEAFDGDEDGEGEVSGGLDSRRGLLCATCGSPLRSALLFGDSQMVAVFEDNREQRFVRALVCPKCGTADLFIDFETEVED